MTPSGDDPRDDPRPAPPPLGPLGGYWRVAVIGVLLVATLALHAISGNGNLGAIGGAITLAFMAAGPGMAIMGLLRLDDLLLELSLALALSLVVETIVAMAMIILKHWVPSDGLIGVEVVAAIGALGQAVQIEKLKRRTSNHRAATRS